MIAATVVTLLSTLQNSRNDRIVRQVAMALYTMADLIGGIANETRRAYEDLIFSRFAFVEGDPTQTELTEAARNLKRYEAAALAAVFLGERIEASTVNLLQVGGDMVREGDLAEMAIGTALLVVAESDFRGSRILLPQAVKARETAFGTDSAGVILFDDVTSILERMDNTFVPESALNDHLRAVIEGQQQGAQAS